MNFALAIVGVCVGVLAFCMLLATDNPWYLAGIIMGMVLATTGLILDKREISGHKHDEQVAFIAKYGCVELFQYEGSPIKHLPESAINQTMIVGASDKKCYMCDDRVIHCFEAD